MEWYEILSQADIDNFMNKFGHFHDGCIKEMHYISGAFVGEDLAMMPINDKRKLKVIFQRQCKDPAAIEVEFSGIIQMNLKPVDDIYTCEMFGAYMKYIDKVIYWADDPDWNLESGDKGEYTWIAARYVRWREADGYLGDRIIYSNVD